jgi:alkanesulfonate monooxygenase SsuD/methylene tetrahydromethanopterin reductase-like flavin-dependent oxidoreductase (luciferase family)
MKIGLLAIAHSPAGGDPETAYQQWLDLALEAERLGFWSVWTTQHHFGTERDYRPFGVSEDEWPTVDYDLAVDPLTMLTWVAANTTRVRLGTAVSVPVWDHPVLVAERAAMLDVLSGGRLELGVARGAGFREIEVFDVPRDDDSARRKFWEAVEIIRRAWTGEPFAFSGEFYDVRELIMVPKPKRQPVPLWIGASSDATAAYAAKIGLPYATTTWPLVDLAAHRAKRDAYLAAAAETGLDTSGFEYPHYLFMYCGESDEEALETARHYITQFQYILEAHYQHARNPNRRFFGVQSNELAGVERVTRATLETQPIGGVETVIEKLKVYERELGLNYLVVNVGWGGMPHAQTVASLRRFAEHVAPHFGDGKVGAAA